MKRQRNNALSSEAIAANCIGAYLTPPMKKAANKTLMMPSKLPFNYSRKELSQNCSLTKYLELDKRQSEVPVQWNY